MVKTIGNPQSRDVSAAAGLSSYLASAAERMSAASGAALPEVRDLTMRDIGTAFRRGMADVMAFRSDVVFVCILYPIIGATLAWFMFHLSLLPLLFPLVAGFALMGPVAAVGLYEMSRRREAGQSAGWLDAFSVLRTRSLAPIVLLGIVLFAVFGLWMLAASSIYAATIGPEAPADAAAFLSDVVGTGAGWTMIVLGVGCGFFFAALTLTISLVSFPMLLDRNIGVAMAVITSVRVVLRNPRIAGIWGLIIAAGLVLGSLPALLGLILVMPVLGHASWHFYRLAVAPETPAA